MGFGLRRGIISSGVLGDNTYAASTSDLNGTTQQFEAADSASLDITGDITVAQWIKFDSASSTQWTFSKRVGASNVSWDLHTFTSKMHFVLNDTGSDSDDTDLASVSSLSNSTWYLIVGVLDGTSQKLYIDGTLDNSGTHTGGIYSGTAKLVVGNFDGSSSYHNGPIGPCGIWDAALSASEITTLYNSGNAFCYDSLPAALTTNLVSYWHLSNWSGSTGTEIEDRHGSNDLTNINSTPFTGTGLTVECA